MNNIRYIQSVEINLRKDTDFEGSVHLDPTPDGDVKIDKLLLKCAELKTEATIKIFDNDKLLYAGDTEAGKLEAFGRLFNVSIDKNFKITMRASGDTTALLILSGKRVCDGTASN